MDLGSFLPLHACRIAHSSVRQYSRHTEQSYNLKARVVEGMDVGRRCYVKCRLGKGKTERWGKFISLPHHTMTTLGIKATEYRAKYLKIFFYLAEQWQKGPGHRKDAFDGRLFCNKDNWYIGLPCSFLHSYFAYQSFFSPCALMHRSAFASSEKTQKSKCVSSNIPKIWH